MDKIQYTQKLIEENIFERKKETIYKYDFSDDVIAKYDELFTLFLEPELQKIIDLQESYSHTMKYVIKSQAIKNYLEKLFLINCPALLKYNLLEQQFFLLYIISISFYRYNDRVLNWSIDEFISRLYLSNIIYIYSKHFSQSKKSIFKIIKNIYKDIKEQSSDVSNSDLYYLNEATIKNDIMQLFLTNILPKFNSLEIENIEDFYTIIFRRIFFFYLKSKTLLTNCINLDNDLIISNEPSNLLESTSERYKIYEEAIYLAQIQQICNNSKSFNNINLEFNKLKKILLPNEIQKLFLNQNSKFKSNLLSYKINFYKISSIADNRIIQIKNKIPIVYKLLRSIHIMSSASSFTDTNKEYMKNQFYIFLLDIFKNKLDPDVISPIINDISNNLVESLTSGEFIDIVTLSQVDINGQKFIDQFKSFLKLVIDSVIVEEDSLNGLKTCTAI